MMSVFFRFVGCIGIVLLASTTWGAITFVDATPNYDPTDPNYDMNNLGNTTVDGALAVTTGTINVDRSTGTGLSTDGLWKYRIDVGVNGGALWQTDNSSTVGETTAPLVTTIVLPGAGSYRLYAMFFSQGDETGTDNTRWDVEGKVGATGTFTTFVDVAPFTGVTGTTVDGSEFSSATMTRLSTDANTKMWLGRLGNFTFNATEAASVQIYINGPDRMTQNPSNPAQLNFGERTWYEGVGFQSFVPGDFDSDGDVDGADFVAWQTNFPKETGATLAEGDADGDGDVDGADFVVWQTNFPFTPGGGATPVPEPAACLLVLAAVGSLGLRKALQRRW
jgi:hypothetical protein